MTGTRPKPADILRENEELRSKLREAQETLEAIRSGGVDALVVATPDGSRVFTLQNADHPYRVFVEEMQQGSVTLSVTGTILYCNKRFTEVVGGGDRSLLGASFSELVAPSSRPAFEALVDRAANGRATAELDLRTVKGEIIPAFLAVNAFPADDSPGLCVVVADLTEQRHHEKIVAAEASLRATLKEKELLLKELQHQVKSSLQMIASMLDLQVSAVEDQAARTPLMQVRDGIRTIASIHEKLYSSHDLTRVPFRAFAAELVTGLHRAFVKGGSPVHLEIDVDDVALDVTTAMPLALILNELVTYAFQQGFPDQREGLVKVGFHEFGDGRRELSVAHDGVELPAGINVEDPGALGLRLVAVLAQQLGGEMELRRGGGTFFAFNLHDAA
jgi:PAS domain S-box-containing protein